MARLGKAAGTLLASASLVLLFACVLTLLILFVLDPGLRTSAEAVVKFLAAVIPGAAVAGFVFRGLARRARQHGTFSRALSSWLAEEWLLQAFVWVFVVVEIVALSYFAPVYALRISVGGDTAVPLSSGLRVVSSPGNVPFERARFDSGVVWFRSARTFRWGDSTLIRVRGAEGYGDDSLVVPWSGFAVFNVLGSITLPQLTLHPSEAQLTISADPQRAEITVRGLPRGSTTFRGPRVLRVPRNAALELIVKAPKYISADTMVLVRDDVALHITLAPVAGQLRLRAVNAGGEEQTGMDVLVDGSDRRYELAQMIQLAPGSYRVRLEKYGPDRIVFAGPFVVAVNPGVTTECRVETTVRAPSTPAPPRGGRVLDCRP